MKADEDGENDGKLEKETEEKARHDDLIEELADVPKITHVEAKGGLGEKTNDKTHGPDAKAKAKDEKEKAGRYEGDDEFVFGGSEGGLEEVEEEIEEKGSGDQKAAKHAGGDTKLDDLVGRGENHVDALEVEAAEGEFDQSLVTETSDEGNAEENTNHDHDFFADVLEIGEIAVDGGLDFGGDERIGFGTGHRMIIIEF